MALSRRWFLASLPAACFGQTTGKGRVLPSAFKRYADPATENAVTRLTDPAHSSILPASSAHSISRHGFLVCASDVSGRYEAYRIDLKSGQQKQLTEASDMDPHSLVLTQDDRSIVYLDGQSLATVSLSTLRAREAYKIPEGRGLGIGVADDGLYTALVEKNEAHFRLQLVNMLKGSAATLAEGEEEISDLIPRPKRASVLYRRGGGLWLANYDGKQNYRLRLAEGGVGPALWNPDGRSIFYLSYPEDPHKLHALREFVPDSNEDSAVANTSQFVGIGRNADASVFVGASGSKASPYVLLLVRAVKRELTLCEHRASDPATVSPVFAPNSQHVYFGSDRHGKPAIYSIAVEKLVEETETA
jgi:oligogalacturonide lyase